MAQGGRTRKADSPFCTLREKRYQTAFMQRKRENEVHRSHTSTCSIKDEDTRLAADMRLSDP